MPPVAHWRFGLSRRLRQWPRRQRKLGSVRWRTWQRQTATAPTPTYASPGAPNYQQPRSRRLWRRQFPHHRAHAGHGCGCGCDYDAAAGGCRPSDDRPQMRPKKPRKTTLRCRGYWLTGYCCRRCGLSAGAVAAAPEMPPPHWRVAKGWGRWRRLEEGPLRLRPASRHSSRKKRSRKNTKYRRSTKKPMMRRMRRREPQRTPRGAGSPLRRRRLWWTRGYCGR